MKISELAVAAYLYECFTGDEGYLKFLNATKGKFDLAQRASREALIKWLNNWGCRQFAVKHHALASRELLKWHKQFGRKLPPAGAKLWKLTDSQLDRCRGALQEPRKQACLSSTEEKRYIERENWADWCCKNPICNPARCLSAMGRSD